MPATRTRVAARRGDASPAERLDLVGREEEAVAGLALDAEVAARVVLDDHRELDAALHVLLDRLDDGRAARRARRRRRRRPRRGRSRTRLPRRSSTPSTVTASGPGRSSSSQYGSVGHRPLAMPNSRIAPCRRISSSGRERLGALEDLARARVGVAHLGLLLVGEAEDVEHEQLVDLAAVEQVARALGRDPRVVREDDRRRRAACRDRPARRRAPARCPRSRRRSASARSSSGGSVSETNAAAARRAGPCGSSRTSAAAPPRGAAAARASCWRSAR